jgi:flagellar biosynthesis chaperone FliJ
MIPKEEQQIINTIRSLETLVKKASEYQSALISRRKKGYGISGSPEVEEQSMELSTAIDHFKDADQSMWGDLDGTK